jgi:branched-chain amino acid transport system substrate-binding protein
MAEFLTGYRSPLRLPLLLAALFLCLATSALAVDPYDIYAILPLTGPNAFVGNEQKTSFELLQADANRGGGVHGRSLRFIIYDSQSNPQIAVQLTGQILAKHPALIIGDSALSTCAAMAPLLANGPLQFCLSPGFVPPPFGTAYSIGTSPPLQSAAILAYARAHGWTRLAMLNQNDATGDSVQRSTNDELVKPINKAIHIVANERFSPGDISIAAQLSRIRAADAQFIVSYNSGAPFGIVVRGLHDAGVDLPVFTSPGNLSYVELKAFGENLPRQLFFVSGPLPPDGPEIENGPLKATDLNFLEAFRRQGLRPDWGNATAWDTGSIVIAALRARGLDAGPTDLRSYINALHGLPAIQGMADFRNGDGRGVSDARILAWDKARNTWSIASGPGGSPKH